MIIIPVALLFLIPALFIGIIPDFTGNYSDQRFFLCFIAWFFCVIVVARFVVLGADIRQLRAVYWTSPLLLVFLSGELYSPVYSVEPLMFVFFFGGAALFGGSLSLSNYLDGIVSGLLIAVVGACLFYGLIAVMIYCFAVFEGGAKVDEFIAWGFPNIRYWSHLATWLIPVLSLAHCRASCLPLPLIRHLVALAGGLWWWIMFSTVSRGSTIGIALAVLISLVFFGRPAFDLVRPLLIHALLGGVFWLCLTVLIPWMCFGAVDLRQIDADSSGRIPLWSEAWQMSLVNFPFGMGPQSWLTHEIITESYRNSKPFGHPHNMYLLWAAEYGWISMLALIFLIVGGSRYLWAVRRQVKMPDDRGLSLIGLTTACLGAAVHAGVSAVLMAPASMLVGFLLLSFFWAILLSQAGASMADKRVLLSPRIGRWIAGVLLMAIIATGVWWFEAVLEYYQDNMLDRQTYQGDRAIYFPRFWSHGDFPRQ